MMNANKLLAMAAAAILVAACSGSGTVPSGDSSGGGGVAPAGGGDGSSGSGAATSGIGGGGSAQFIGFDGEQPGDAEVIRNNLVIYFEFDSSEILSEFNGMLATHARYMAASPDVTVRLEGHADERGSREYNIGLGERRAQAVRQILMLQGVSTAQLSTVSYGEERPAAFGSDEQSYSQNRRVELVYR
jgi:peptidoglycan-associated lipoprotein